MQDTIKGNTNGNFKKSQLKVVSKDTSYETTTVFHRAEAFLTENYKIRYNTISLQIEWYDINLNKWASCNDNSIWVSMQKRGIKIGHGSLKAILKSDYVPKYNPFVDYFENLPVWDKKIDYISQYLQYIQLETGQDFFHFSTHFKKWCVRAVKCALLKDYFNKQAFILTDDGKGQNIGKSTWCRNLCPKPLFEFLAEDFNNNDKDSRILICKNFIINLDELAALSKKEINQLKSIFSKNQINERLPYDSKNSIISRTASFIGSTNMTTFLHDETGSVRWLCFVIKDIDWTYKKNFNIDNLWSQAYYLSNDNSFSPELTRDDILENEKRNGQFQFLSTERELLEKYFHPSNKLLGKHETATEISTYIKNRSGSTINIIVMGKALKQCHFERIKLDGRYGYYVTYKKIEYC